MLQSLVRCGELHLSPSAQEFARRMKAGDLPAQSSSGTAANDSSPQSAATTPSTPPGAETTAAQPAIDAPASGHGSSSPADGGTTGAAAWPDVLRRRLGSAWVDWLQCLDKEFFGASNPDLGDLWLCVSGYCALLWQCCLAHDAAEARRLAKQAMSDVLAKPLPESA